MAHEFTQPGSQQNRDLKQLKDVYRVPAGYADVPAPDSLKDAANEVYTESIARIADEIFNGTYDGDVELALNHPDIIKEVFEKVTTFQVDIEEMRAFADKSVLKHSRRERVANNLLARVPQSFEERLVDAESIFVEKVFSNE